MKSIIPEIHVTNCSEVIEFYKNVFGGEVKNVQMADNIPMFKGHEGKIIHSELHINDSCVLYLVDIFDDNKTESSIALVMEMDSEEETNRIFKELSQDGLVKFELQKTFWGAYHGVVTDKYDNTWGLNYTLRNSGAII